MNSWHNSLTTISYNPLSNFYSKMFFSAVVLARQVALSFEFDSCPILVGQRVNLKQDLHMRFLANCMCVCVCVPHATMIIYAIEYHLNLIFNVFFLSLSLCLSLSSLSLYLTQSIWADLAISILSPSSRHARKTMLCTIKKTMDFTQKILNYSFIRNQSIEFLACHKLPFPLVMLELMFHLNTVLCSLKCGPIWTL